MLFNRSQAGDAVLRITGILLVNGMLYYVYTNKLSISFIDS